MKMGRRSINTTKSGKYMNPTDQARKEARKRELKKNKKQRMLVRTAVLKGKDPHQVLADMERLDLMEFNVDAPPPLNEKVLRDKRRKLKETWDRLCRLYVKEDHDKFVELKRMENEYESKRNQLIKFYEAVKSAQEVALEEIPLPSGPPEPVSGDENNDGEQPEEEPSSILKRNVSSFIDKDPPGLPPGPPPSLNEIDEGKTDDEEDGEDEDAETNKKVHFGENEKEDDIDEFLKEIENVEKTVTGSDKNNPSSPEDSQTTDLIQRDSESTRVQEPPAQAGANLTPSSTKPTSFSSTNIIPSSVQLQPAPPPIPPPILLLRPPLLPNQMRPGMMPGNSGPPLRPMGPPHQRPQRHGGPRLGPGHQGGGRHQQNQHNNRKEDRKSAQMVSDKATIEAKPQLRNLSADAIRFTPLSLKIRRNDRNSKKLLKPEESNFSFTSNVPSNMNDPFKQQQPTKDDAYEEFMRELKDII